SPTSPRWQRGWPVANCRLTCTRKRPAACSRRCAAVCWRTAPTVHEHRVATRRCRWPCASLPDRVGLRQRRGKCASSVEPFSIRSGAQLLSVYLLFGAIQRTQCTPRLDIPMPSSLPGRRRQHEHLRLADALVLQAAVDGMAQRGPRGILAGEGDEARCVALDFRPQCRRVEGITRELVVIAAVALGEVGEADAELWQQREFGGRELARREAGFEQRAPEQVAGMGVVGPFGG